MAIFFDAPVSPDALTAFVREVPTDPTLQLSNLFPVQTTDDNTIDFADIIHTNRTAKYRSFDGRIHVSERDTGSDKRVRLLPLSSSLGVGEYERLQLQFARTGGTNMQALANAVYNDADNLTREVRNRLELAWGDVITDGRLTINENGFIGEADFGVPAGHLITAGTLWSNTAAPILDNLVSWSDTYAATNGFMPGQIRVSQRVSRAMQVNTQLINAAVGSAAGRTRINLNELNDVLASEGLPPITRYETKSLDVDGVTTPTMPDDRVIMLPPNVNDLGYTAFGVTATALELMNSANTDFSFADAPGIVGVVLKDGPPFRQFTYVDAVAMPILANARLLLNADVM
jgi:hypothetical protein